MKAPRNSRPFAVFMPKIVRFGESLT